MELRHVPCAGCSLRGAGGLTAQELRLIIRQAAGDVSSHHIAGDESRDRQRTRLTPAAVLIGIVDRPDGLSLILTRRTAHLNAHAGQISLPGGRMEPEDPNAPAAALREAQEEVGLDPEAVDILGGLRTYDTVTGFRVHPVVGWIRPPVDFSIDPFEVDELFEVPFAYVIDPANQRRDSFLRDGVRRHFWAIPYGPHYIWGATAGMLVNFSRLLNGQT